jgi:hypothetical protein
MNVVEAEVNLMRLASEIISQSTPRNAEAEERTAEVTKVYQLLVQAIREGRKS